MILLIVHPSFLFLFCFLFGSPTLLISPRGLDSLVLTEEIVASGNEIVFVKKILTALECSVALFEVPVRCKCACVLWIVSETLDTALGCGFSVSDDYLQLWHSYCDYMRRRVDDWSEGTI